jgi:hypothetical protein
MDSEHRVEDVKRTLTGVQDGLLVEMNGNILSD